MYLHTNIAASTDSGCKMYLSFSELGIFISMLDNNGELNSSSLNVEYNGQVNRKWHSSSIFWELQRVHILFSLGIFLYLPTSIWREWHPSRRQVRYFLKCLSLIAVVYLSMSYESFIAAYTESFLLSKISSSHLSYIRFCRSLMVLLTVLGMLLRLFGVGRSAPALVNSVRNSENGLWCNSCKFLKNLLINWLVQPNFNL